MALLTGQIRGDIITVPPLLKKRFADLRDTAVTYLYEATGGDIGRWSPSLGIR
ncbi:MAG: hypothetical protein J0H79_11775 [Alphaproteobacteria bacterium]|nr:hypothetical protein [Alphaproteobacteria bacterium]